MMIFELEKYFLAFKNCISYDVGVSFNRLVSINFFSILSKFQTKKC